MIYCVVNICYNSSLLFLAIIYVYGRAQGKMMKLGSVLPEKIHETIKDVLF